MINYLVLARELFPPPHQPILVNMFNKYISNVLITLLVIYFSNYHFIILIPPEEWTDRSTYETMESGC